MPTFYNYRENNQVYSFDDVFVPADAFRQGNLWVWGSNSRGGLGNNTVVNISTPVTTFAGGANWKQINGTTVGGGSFDNTSMMAIKTDGTLWGWGSNSYGQLGNNTFSGDRSLPNTTFVGGTNWKQVSVSRATGAIKTDGTLWVWGNNGNAQLGNNTINSSVVPITTFAGGTNWKQVSCGYFHTLAIKTDGTLWTWGRNAYGELGNNITITRSTPVTTFAGGNNWKQCYGSRYASSAIKTDGTLWTWGYAAIGQLGNNSGTNALTPVTTFLGGSNWKLLSVGGSNAQHNAAIKTDGTLWVWGQNNNGQLGINNTNVSYIPRTTFAGGTNWKQVSCNFGTTVAIKTDGTLWTWGRNQFGGLGDNTTTNRSTPVTTFAGGTNWNQVCSAGYTTVALTYIDDYQ